MTIYNDNIARPYVYKITYNDTGEYYFGYREANDLPASLDIGSKYFTSSDVIKERGLEHSTIEIMSEFDESEAANYCNWTTAGDAAFEYEQYSLYLVWGDPLLLNGQYRWPIKDGKMFKVKSGNENCRTDKSYEEIFGVDEGKRLRGSRSSESKGKSYEERYGVEKAKELKKQRATVFSKANKGRKPNPISVKKANNTREKNRNLPVHLLSSTVHHWFHKDGREEFLTRRELVKTHKVSNAVALKVLKGKLNRAGGWSIVPPNLIKSNIRVGTNHQKVNKSIHCWVNDKLSLSAKCTIYQLAETYNLKTGALHAVVRGVRPHTGGGD